MSKIFIVEDEGAIADLEKDYLELSGFEVEVENDGNMGLQKALEEDFDLLILDLMLPGVDGFEICRRFGMKRMCRLSWYLLRKTISIRSGVWDLEPMTI